METKLVHPAIIWEKDAGRQHQFPKIKLRLAAMAGHNPSLKRPISRQYGAVSWDLINAIGRLPVPEKNKRAFAAADFALRQKRLILTEEHPDWSEGEVDEEARCQVYGVDEKWLT